MSEKWEPFGWPFVRSARHRDEVDSTNDWARRLIETESLGDLPALIWADRQTRGRGQGANAWWSDNGSLTASVVIDPAAHGLGIAIRPRVALGVATVVVAAVAEVAPGCQVGIRWPNDVEVAGRKLGGILVEPVATPDGARLIVGIGLNVGTRLGEAPGEVQRLAGSLAEFGLNADDRPTVLQAILARFAGMLGQVASGDPALASEWSRLDTLSGATITVQVGSNQFEAVAAGIDPTGGLRIRRDDRLEILVAGRILRT